MTEILIVAGAIGIITAVIIFLNWRELRASKEMNEINKTPPKEGMKL
ncbi:MAG: hypothetical protein V1701_02955 [Planctomycetota bacterium]